MMRSPVCAGRVAGSALAGQTQSRERHHADVTFDFSRFTKVLHPNAFNPEICTEFTTGERSVDFDAQRRRKFGVLPSHPSSGLPEFGI